MWCNEHLFNVNEKSVNWSLAHPYTSNPPPAAPETLMSYPLPKTTTGLRNLTKSSTIIDGQKYIYAYKINTDNLPFFVGYKQGNPCQEFFDNFTM